MAEESVRTEFDKLCGEMDAGFERVYQEFEKLRGEMHEGFARVEAKIAEQHVETEKAIKTLLYAIVSIGGAIVIGIITALIRLWTMQ